jgi:hypothetical protein
MSAIHFCSFKISASTNSQRGDRGAELQRSPNENENLSISILRVLRFAQISAESKPAESTSKYHPATKRMKDTKDSELLHFSSLNFVIFATFVVNVLFLFWLRLRRIRPFVVRRYV